MRLLLDTHIALWAIVDDPKLPSIAQRLIAEPGNEVFVSVVSLWEIAIKRALARGRSTDMPISAKEALRYCQEAGYRILEMTAEHAVAVESLPTRHADPFDRLLVAQALSEPMRLITHDAKVAAYGETIMRV